MKMQEKPMKTFERFHPTFTKRALTRQKFGFAALLAFWVTLMLTGSAVSVYAQSREDYNRAVDLPATDQTQDESVDPDATAGPTFYVTDAAGRLATITLGTYKVHIIGSEGVVLTDLAFNPTDGLLYGVSFTSFYRVSPLTGKATFIGKLGISDANALVFTASGEAYTEGITYAELYRVNTATGHASPVGSTNPFRSAGALVVYDGGFVLAGYYQPSMTSTTPDTLALLNPKTGQPLAYAELRLANLYGLASTGKELYGFAETSIYQLLPGESNISKRVVLLKDLAGKGLAQIYGAAYDSH
jgi:hypothetical protein